VPDKVARSRIVDYNQFDPFSLALFAVSINGNVKSGQRGFAIGSVDLYQVLKFRCRNGLDTCLSGTI
jgi:hypothetical protein